MPVKLSNNAVSSLVASITFSADEISIQNADAGLFPVLAGGNWHPATIKDSSNNMEIVRVIGRAGNVLTVERAQEGTTARDFPAGSKISVMVTKAVFDSIQSQFDDFKTSTEAAFGETDSAIDELAGVVNTKAAKDYVDAQLLRAAPPGAVISFARSTPPTGWLAADGSALSRTVYANLFAVIGTVFGAGDGATTFNLPDGRGEVIRGWDNGRGLDAGRVFGSIQESQNKEHAHAVTDPGHNHPVTDPGHYHPIPATSQGNGNSYIEIGGSNDAGPGYTSTSYTGISVGNRVTGISIQNSGGAEARVHSIALLCCIKY